MCGRFVLETAPEMLAEAFDAPNPPRLVPRYNIAPSQLVAVVGLKGDGETRGIAQIKWGLVAHWSNGSGPKPINARAETVAFKFGDSLREKRCLIPATGFYEWVKEGGRKRARHFSLIDGSVFAFAGLWDAWQGEKQTLVTTCMVTTAANDRVRPVHDRMPVIVPKESYEEWLDLDTPKKRLLELLRQYPAEVMKMAKVGLAVNSPKHDGPECLEAA